MLGHRLRRWPNIKTSLRQRLVFAGMIIRCWVDDIADRVESSPVVSNQKAVTALFSSEPILPFDFCLQSSTKVEIQAQIIILAYFSTAYFSSKQLLLYDLRLYSEEMWSICRH